MPLPTPSKNEKAADFIERCMRDLNEEYPDNKQRYAICLQQERKRKDS